MIRLSSGLCWTDIVANSRSFGRTSRTIANAGRTMASSGPHASHHTRRFAYQEYPSVFPLISHTVPPTKIFPLMGLGAQGGKWESIPPHPALGLHGWVIKDQPKLPVVCGLVAHIRQSI